MANIPLADFPNAPALAPVSAEISAPAPNFDFGDLSGAVQSLAQSQISGQALDTYGRGLNQLAGGIADLGNFPKRVMENITAARELGDQARVADILDTSYSKHMETMQTQGVPPDQWLPTWEKALPDVQKQIDALGLSPEMQQKTSADLIRFSSSSAINIRTAATKKGIEIDSGDVMNRANRAFDEGRYEEAHTFLGEGVKRNLWTKEKADAQWLEWEGKQRNEGMTQWLAADPKGMAEVMEGSITEGKNKEFPWLTVDRMRFWQQKARTEERFQETQMFTDAQNDVATGGVADVEQLRAKYGASLPANKMKVLEKGIKSLVVYDPAVHAPIISDIRTKIMAYNGGEDTGLKDMNEIQLAIADLPRDKQGPLNSLLSQTFNATAREGKPKDMMQRRLSYFYKELDARGRSGLFGETGRDAKHWTKITDPAKSAAFGIKLNDYKDRLEVWAQENPNSTPKDMADFMNDLVGADAKRAAINGVQPKKKSGWIVTPFALPMWGPVEQGQSPLQNDSVIQEIDKFTPPSSTPAAPSPFDPKAPASIRYNNPGAMYPGPSSEKFGSVATETIGGGHKIAVFPDAVSGAAAQFDLLATRYTGKTLADAIKKWSGGNDVSTYLGVIQRETGLKPSDVLTPEMMRNPEIAISIAKAMAVQEAGKPFPLSDDQWMQAHTLALKS